MSKCPLTQLGNKALAHLLAAVVMRYFQTDGTIGNDDTKCLSANDDTSNAPKLSSETRHLLILWRLWF